ncbi:MAG: alpha/beta hydrolase [Gemmataceae bacterium]
MIASQRWLELTGAQFKAHEARRACAHLSNYTVEYTETGDGPPIVLVPGLAGGFELLGPLTQRLSRHFRVISYQLRGEDNCFALRAGFGVVDLVKDLGEFLDWMRLESPILFGLSFGGIIALEFAARHPLRLSHLILQGTGARLEPGLLPMVAGNVLSRYPLPADSPFVNQFFNLFFGSAQRKDGRFDFVTRECWKTDQSVMAHRFRLAEQFDVQPRLERIRVPTLLLAGERDVMVSPRGLEELKEGIDKARIQPLPRLWAPGVRHSIPTWLPAASTVFLEDQQ